MKIEKLFLKNFGPFVDDNEIDFQLLEDIFLIYGNTGSGKTTIFDAVSFALYGKLPGAREKQDIRKCRSDFAKLEDEAFIEIVFRVRENLYRVKRSLPQEYITRNNTKSEKPSTIVLEQEKKGENWKILSDNLTDANNAIEQIIGLTATEFSTIILLPQGEFAQFLKQSSQQRRESLSTLFPMDLYKNFMTEIKLKADDFKKRYELIEQNIIQLQNQFSIDTTDKIQNEFTKKIENAKKEKSKLLKVLTEHAEKKEKLKHALSTSEKFIQIQKDLDQCEAELKALREQEESIQKKEIQVKKLDYALKDLEKTETQLKAIETARANHIAVEKNTAILENKIIELKKSLDSNEKKLKNLLEDTETLIVLLEEKNKSESFIQELKLKIIEIKKRNELEDSILSYIAIAKKLNEEKESLLRHIENAKLILHEFIEKDRENKLGYEASLIAKDLEDGKACPVCGSTIHPSKAKEVPSLLSLDEKIESQKKLIDESEKNLQLKENELTKKETEKNIAEKNLLSIQIKDDLQSVEEKLRTLENAFALVLEKIDIKQKEETEKERLSKEIKNYQNTISETESYFQSEKTKKAVIEQEIKSYEKEVYSILENHKNLFENEKIIENFSIEKIQKADFSFEMRSSIENLKNRFIMFTEKIAEYKESKTLNEKNLHRLQGQMEETKSSLIQIAKYFPETKSLETYLSRLEPSSKIKLEEIEAANFQNLVYQNQSLIDSENKQLQEIEENIETMQASLSQEKNLSQRYADLSQELKSLQEKSQDIALLNNLVIGKNEKKTPLDAWVLGLFLEEIIIHATKRLEKLSSGRYTFSLLTESEGGRGFKGLEIEIFDSFTGKNRPPSTLSGGETFIASISLALALTDVVQSRAGGISIESLFIDEGFGSLDPESLELALGIIDEIREERIVGLISHVGDLGTRINSQIIVHKTKKGSKISLP